MKNSWNHLEHKKIQFRLHVYSVFLDKSTHRRMIALRKTSYDHRFNGFLFAGLFVRKVVNVNR